MFNAVTVTTRVDRQIKEQAAEVLASVGLSVSDAVRSLLNWVAVERRLPFETRGPNAESQAAIIEANEILNSHGARFQTASELFDDLEKNTSR